MHTDDFLALQKKWQQAWKDQNAFEPEPDPNKEKFFMTTPFPYVSGSLHIGHARVVCEADVFSRYQRMTGKNVLYPMAFHISGTPVLGISLAIAQGDQAKRELYASYVRTYIPDEEDVQRTVDSFKDPFKIVEFFVPKMQEEFSQLGLAIDWRRSFTSGDDLHRAMVDWQFRKYKEKNYLVQGAYPVLYSLSLKSAVGEDDITDGDTLPVDKMEFTLVKFAYEDGYLVAATLRPETLYGQTNMWVNPDIDYVKAKVDQEVWYLSKACAEKLTYQNKTVTILETLPGKSLLGKTCKAPFLNTELLILPSRHCDPDIGSGMVTSVPSDAPFDWVMLHKLQENETLCQQYGLDYKQVTALQPIPIIHSKGYGEFPAVEICEQQHIKPADTTKLEKATQEIYKAGYHTGVMRDNCGPYAGMPASKAKEAMRQALLDQNQAIIFYETSRKAVSRDGGKIIVSLLDNQWFLDFNAGTWKQDAHQLLNQMQIIPEKYRKQFQDVFAWLDKRPCARKRGLGTKLPFDPDWVIESLSDSTLYIALYTIAHLAKKHRLTFDQMNASFFDYVFLDALPVAEAAKTTNISEKALQELRYSFAYWYPNDHRHTFNAHLANHLSFLIFAHVAIMPETCWPKTFSFHGMVISEGHKMSKSKGNIVTLLDVIQQYGADVFRAFICNATSVESTFNWETSEVQRLKKHLGMLVNLLENAIKTRDASSYSPERFRKEHAAYISRFERAVKEATHAIDAFDLRTYSTIALYELTNHYKKEVQKISHDAERLAALNMYSVERWIRLLAPLIPHAAEELWQALGNTTLVSLAPWPSFYEVRINEKEEYKALLLDNLLADIRAVQQLAKRDALSEIRVFIPKQAKYDFFAFLKEQRAKTSHPQEVMRAIMTSSFKNILPNLPPKVPKLLEKLPPVLISQQEEKDMLHNYAGFLEKTFGATVTIISEEHAQEKKAVQALPGKPAILVW